MKTILSLILIFVGFSVGSQINYPTTKSNDDSPTNEAMLKEAMLTDVVSTDNIESYKIEYELIDYSFPAGDSSILEMLNMDEIYTVRKVNEDFAITNIEHGVVILLYSYKKALLRRSELSEAEQIRN